MLTDMVIGLSHSFHKGASNNNNSSSSNSTDIFKLPQFDGFHKKSDMKPFETASVISGGEINVVKLTVQSHLVNTRMRWSVWLLSNELHATSTKVLLINVVIVCRQNTTLHFQFCL